MIESPGLAVDRADFNCVALATTIDLTGPGEKGRIAYPTAFMQIEITITAITKYILQIFNMEIGCLLH